MSARRLVLAVAVAAVALSAAVAGGLLLVRLRGRETPLAEWLAAGRSGGIDLAFELATVDGEGLHRGELYDYVLPPRAGAGPLRPLWPDVFRRAASDIAGELAIEAAALSSRLDIPHSALEARYARVLSRTTGREVRFGTREAEAVVRALGVADGELRRQVALMLATEELMRRSGLDCPDPFAQGTKPVYDDFIRKVASSAAIENDPAKLGAEVVIRVAGADVTRAELARRMLRAAPAEAADGALDVLIGRRILEKESARRGIALAKEDLTVHMRYMEDTFRVLPELRPMTLKDHLDSRRITAEEFASSLDFRLNAMITRLARERLKPEAVEAALAANPTRYGIGQRRVAHILLSARDALGKPLAGKELEAARSRMEAIHTALVAGTSKFEDVASKVNSDGSELQGGSLGWVARGERSEEFSRAAYETPVGSISPPFGDAAGLHVVKVLEERTLPAAEARALAECDLLIGLRNDVRRELFSAAKIVRSGAGY